MNRNYGVQTETHLAHYKQAFHTSYKATKLNMNATDLLLNLRVAIRLNKTKLALRLTVSIHDHTRLPLSHVAKLLARCLLEDKYPEAQRYFKAFKEITLQMNAKNRKFKLDAYLLPAVYCISKLPSDSTVFQMAFMKMSGHEIANKNLSEAVDRSINMDYKGDDIFLDKCSSPTLLHVWSKDVVIQSVWRANNKINFEPRGFQQLPSPFANLSPAREDEFIAKKVGLYGEEKVKGFTKEMSKYIAKYGDRHFTGEPVLLTLRRELRYEKVFPIRCEVEMIRRLSRVKDGWLVEWKGKTYKLTLPKRTNKKTVEIYRKAVRKRGEDKIYEINRPEEICLKWRDTIMFMYEQVEGEDVSLELLRGNRGIGFEVMKTLVYRYVKNMETYWRDLQVVTENIYSVNELKVKGVRMKKTKDVWLNLIRNKKSARIKKIVDELKEYLRSFGKEAFKEYMEKIKQVKLYEQLMKTLETA